MKNGTKLNGDAARQFLEGCRIETKGRLQCNKTKHRFAVVRLHYSWCCDLAMTDRHISHTVVTHPADQGEARLTCDMEGRRRCYTLEAAFEECGHLFKPTKTSKYGALSLQVRPSRPTANPSVVWHGTVAWHAISNFCAGLGGPCCTGQGNLLPHLQRSRHHGKAL